MSLSPNKEDVRKIHAEINQIVNQRFLITTFAITIFGIIASWMIPKNTPDVGSNIGAFTFAASILLIIMLFILFLLSHFLKGMLRILTTYLLVSGESNWERDWKEYRKKGHWAYTIPQTGVFLGLGFLSTIFPFVLAYVYSLKLEPVSGFWLDILFGVVYFLLVWVIGKCKLMNNETEVKESWEELNKAQ